MQTFEKIFFKINMAFHKVLSVPIFIKNDTVTVHNLIVDKGKD